MSKPKKVINYGEIDEIISLKLKELGGIRKRLTYNSVWKFNCKIAKNEEFKRKNGELFNEYGYCIWAGNYKGEDYYGKRKIDEIKANSNIKVVGEEFVPGIQDIIMLVNDFSSKPEILAKKLVSMFEKDKKKIDILEKEVGNLTEKCKQLTNRMELFEKGLATVFYNSASDNNSLLNVMCMTKSKDESIYNELMNMFDQDKARLSQIIKKANEPSLNIEKTNTVIDMELEKKQKRRHAYQNDL